MSRSRTGADSTNPHFRGKAFVHLVILAPPAKANQRKVAFLARRKGLVISDRQMQLVDEILDKLRHVSGSRFIALVSTSGQPITTSTVEEHPDTLSLASLAASSFAATQQLAAVLHEREFTLLFHEGRESNLHVAQVTDQVLLVITFGRETQVGKVRLYTSRAVEVLRPIFEASDADDAEPLMIDDDYSLLADEAIDDLFADME
jgi:predicted regulator of Ras-like GTPase activity (Roadblock/LC7/MglB family)